MIGRRSFVRSLPALVMAPRVMAQPAAPIATRRLNNVVIGVSDMKRSLEFYQRLFGPAVVRGDTAVFRVGEGPHFFALTAVKGGAKPDFLSYGLTVDNFDPDRILKAVTALGVSGARATTREGTAELWVPDPD